MPDILATSTTTGVSVAKESLVYNDPSGYFNLTGTYDNPIKYIKKIPSEIQITAPVSAGNYLKDYHSLEDISNINFTGCTSMKDTFWNCYALNNIDLSLPVCTDISYIVEYCTSLKTLTLRNLNVVTAMTSFCAGCNALETITLSDMPALTTFVANITPAQTLIVGDLPLVTAFSLSGSARLTSLALGSTPNLTDLSRGFLNCLNLLEIPYLDTSKVTNMYWCFENCGKITTIPLLDTSKVTNMEELFYRCSNLEVVPALDVSSVTNFKAAFNNASKVKEIHWTGAKYSWDCSASTQFTESALIEILNNLGNAYNNAQTLTMGSTNKAKLTSAEGVAALAAAQAKGWTVN